jgi:ATP dependent DNA ligase C terminal region
MSRRTGSPAGWPTSPPATAAWPARRRLLPTGSRSAPPTVPSPSAIRHSRPCRCRSGGSGRSGRSGSGGEERLRVVGHCSGLRASEKRRLVSFLAAYETGERGTADPSRWSSGRDLEWVALRPELVVEIDFDHVSAGRIRHGAKLRRWRDDKSPLECTFDQLSS